SCPLGLSLTGVPELAHADVGERRQEATEMIRVRVGEDDDVDFGSTPASQHGSNDRPPGIDRTADQSTGVDEHRTSVGELQHRCVSLADVENGDSKLVAR